MSADREVVPPSAEVDAQVESDLLHDWRLRKRERVTVELVVAATMEGIVGSHAIPRSLDAYVAGATGRVLLLDHTDGTPIRVPWSAIALIRATPQPRHPAI